MRLSFCTTYLAILLLALLSVNQNPVSASDNLMQCMTKCLKFEGNTPTSKNTCKLRCSNYELPNLEKDQTKDCMSIFKICRSVCKKSDQNCKRECKKALMGCS